MVLRFREHLRQAAGALRFSLMRICSCLFVFKRPPSFTSMLESVDVSSFIFNAALHAYTTSLHYFSFVYMHYSMYQYFEIAFYL